MPHYDYRCSNEHCKNEFEIFQSIHDAALTHCDKCDTASLQRVISIPLILDLTPRTFGTLAEQNNKVLGKEQVELKAIDAKKNVRKLKPKRPSWRPDMDKPDMNICKFTPAETKRYIEEGVRPIGK